MISSTHPFAKTLGPGPYRFLGAVQIIKPSEAMPEGNYRQLRQETPSRFVRGMGTCAHCGMAIMNVYFVEVGNGDVYGVGSDCIMKTAQAERFETTLVKQVREHNRKLDREKRHGKKLSDKATVRELLEVHEPELAAMPHPRGYEGKSFYDYAAWMLDNAGAAGMKRVRGEITKVLGS